MALKILSSGIVEDTIAGAKASERKRLNHNFHRLEETLQRLVNAVEPESYIRPHRHSNPPKVEFFLIIKGRGAAFLFDDEGRIEESHVMEPGGDVVGVEFPAGSWHALVSLAPGTAFFEAKEGPYDTATDKEFAMWAPPESDKDAGAAYLKELKAHALKE